MAGRNRAGRERATRGWTASRVLAGATLVVMGLGGGAWAGMDAAAQVDARYRFAPALPISRPVPVAAPRSSQGDVEEPVMAAIPPAGSAWGREIGRDERAFFDPTVGEEPPPVRVHRAPRDEPLWSPGVNAPSTEGDGEDGPIGLPDLDKDQPMPTAG